MTILSEHQEKFETKNPLKKLFIQGYLDQLGKLARSIPYCSFCDLGCGEGYVLEYLTKHRKVMTTELIGVDRNQDALKIAEQKVPFAQYRCGSLEKLKFNDKQFDCSLLLEVLEHVNNPAETLKHAARISKHLIISVPNEPYFQMACKLGGQYKETAGNHPGHIHHWSKQSFQELLEQHGRVLKLTTPFPWLLAAIKTN